MGGENGCFQHVILCDPYTWAADYFEPNNTAKITFKSSTELRWRNEDGTVVRLIGTGFLYDGNVAVDGIVTQIEAGTLIGVSQVNGDLSSLFDFAFGFARSGGERQEASGFDFLTALLRGNDTINGSPQGDTLVAGRNPAMIQ